jgi:hypothetical protein
MFHMEHRSSRLEVLQILDRDVAGRHAAARFEEKDDPVAPSRLVEVHDVPVVAKDLAAGASEYGIAIGIAWLLDQVAERVFTGLLIHDLPR